MKNQRNNMKQLNNMVKYHNRIRIMIEVIDLMIEYKTYSPSPFKLTMQIKKYYNGDGVGDTYLVMETKGLPPEYELDRKWRVRISGSNRMTNDLLKVVNAINYCCSGSVELDDLQMLRKGAVRLIRGAEQVIEEIKIKGAA